MSETQDNNVSVVKHRIDDATFYGIFALALALLVVYMAWDMRNAIDAATKSITLAQCNQILINQSRLSNVIR